MKVSLNCRERELEPGTRLIQVVDLIRETKKNEPVIRLLIEKTGQDQLVFVVNGRLVRPPEYGDLELQDGDDIRWLHPFFGG